jgi:hypothetical protein
MNDQKREEITKLAKAVYDKKYALVMHRERNIANLSYELAKQAMVDCELARAEYYEACAALEAAMPGASERPANAARNYAHLYPNFTGYAVKQGI